jgi:large subunit ribosomal protein L19
MRKLSEVEKPHLRKQPVRFSVGDNVNVGVVITETVEKKGKLEEKERVQVFSGRVIGRRGTGVNECFTVRRIVSGEGVERVFPVHSPKVAYVEVVSSARVRRAKLYFLRERSGKSTRLRERIGARETASAPVAAPSAATAAAPAAATAAPGQGGASS